MRATEVVDPKSIVSTLKCCTVADVGELERKGVIVEQAQCVQSSGGTDGSF